MVVFLEGPRGGNLDYGLQAYVLQAVESFGRQLGIHRLKTFITIKFHHNICVDRSRTCVGLCEAENKREFTIDVALYGNWLTTLAHEMVHVKQFARGELNESLTRFKGKDYSNTKYWDQPWEVEARKLQYNMVIKFENQ